MTNRELRLRQRIDQLLDRLALAEDALAEAREGRKYWWTRARRLEQRLDLHTARNRKNPQ